MKSVTKALPFNIPKYFWSLKSNKKILVCLALVHAGSNE
jgi:hypothetical protein